MPPSATKRYPGLTSLSASHATHGQIEAPTLADRIAARKDRAIQQPGTPADICNRPANRCVASCVGSPSMTFLPGVLRLKDGKAVAVPGDSALPPDGYAFAQPPRDGQSIELGIRPEPSPTGAGASLPVTVDKVEPTGADTLPCRNHDALEISIRAEAGTRIADGDKFDIDLPAGKLSPFAKHAGLRLRNIATRT